jgi:hypothetical protein
MAVLIERIGKISELICYKVTNLFKVICMQYCM